MRTAIRRALEEDPRIEIVGEASNFTEVMQMIADFKPSVLLLDLHIPGKGDFAPALVKSRLENISTLAVSFSNDSDSKVLAESYGAARLLDKMTLYADMMPAIRQC